jgi:hypothetical protein
MVCDCGQAENGQIAADDAVSRWRAPAIPTMGAPGPRLWQERDTRESRARAPGHRPPWASPAPGEPPRRDDRDGGRAWPGPSPWGLYYPYAPPPAWVPGHWEWDGRQRVWEAGHWCIQ